MVVMTGLVPSTPEQGADALSTWMVVEDEPGLYEVLLAMFDMWGVGGVAFVDGEEAVAWIEDVDTGRAKGERPELALVDIRLPGAVQGEMVGARLRKSPALHDITIVLITAFLLTAQEEKEVMATAQADRIIYKPLPRFEDLKIELEKTLAARQARTTSASKQPAATSGASASRASASAAFSPTSDETPTSVPAAPHKAASSPNPTSAADAPDSAARRGTFALPDRPALGDTQPLDRKPPSKDDFNPYSPKREGA
jgi:CheY-like chemotaxis protein